MNDELIFRGSLAGASLLLALIRLYYGWLARQAHNPVSFSKAGRVRMVLVWLFGLMATSVSALYVLAPEWMAWATLPLPISVRWLGVGLGLVVVWLFWWVHQALGTNWAMPAVIKTQQTLVTHGPYRWVRHPMYATLFVWALAYWLISANGFIGVAWLALGLMAATLISAEEAALIEKFGAAYRAYMQRTGRFLPRFKQ